MRENLRTVHLEESGLSADVALPVNGLVEACGSRFDGSGIAEQVTYAGHTFFAFDPAAGLLGTAEEFSTVDPPGFAEAEIGAGFHKIGAGFFRKNSEIYTRFQPSEKIRPAVWSVACSADQVEFKTSEECWIYTKRLAVSGNSLTVFRTLENRGDIPLCTDHYCHSFFQIDQLPAGPDYLIEFDAPLHLRETRSRTLGLIQQHRGSFMLSGPIPDNESVMLYFQTLETCPQTALVRNRKSGATVQIETSLPVTEWRFFATSQCLCPEPFVELHVPPGETMRWDVVYRFSVS